MDTAQDQPGIEGTDHAAEIPQAFVQQGGDVVARTHDRAAHRVSVTTQILCHRVHDRGHSQFEWLLQCGARESIVDYSWNTPRPAQLRECRDIQDVQNWITGALEIDKPGIGPDRFFEVLDRS